MKRLKEVLSKFGLLPYDLHALYSSSGHSPYIASHRSLIINERIKIISLMFSLMIVIWMPIDFFLLPGEVAFQFALLRLGASTIFVVLALSVTKDNRSSHAYLRLIIMMLVPCVFYAFAQILISGIEVDRSGQILVGIYEFLPFLIVAGLALFPLTLIEISWAGIIIFTAIGGSVVYSHDTIPLYDYSAAWLLLLILAADMLSAAIQLKYMSSLLSRISTDTLTGAISRHAGQDIIDLHFELSIEEDKPFAIAFIDLDHFKQINDEYGHDAGDTALIGAVQLLKGILRRGDQVIRWGGEEFIVMLLDADIDGTRLVLDRIKSQWLGLRPDNTSLTASIGVAERVNDSVEDWTVLVELADQRMYQAKQAGRAQAIFK